MQYTFHDPLTGANLWLMVRESYFRHTLFGEAANPVLTIAWNRGRDQHLFVDGESLRFPAQTVATLVINQTFQFEYPQDLAIWQFDKPFFCVEENDSDVSCVGILFWGNRDFLPIRVEKDKMEMLLSFFTTEFETHDRVQGEMLRALLKRLIVNLTAMTRAQAIHSDFRNADLDVARQFNVLVEKHFRRLHQVQDYAQLLDKSPKTLANVFALYNNKGPLEVIHERIILEARRMLLYTDKTVKEIAEHLGYEEVSHFSRLFKNIAGIAPSDWRKEPQKTMTGDIDK